MLLLHLTDTNKMNFYLHHLVCILNCIKIHHVVGTWRMQRASLARSFHVLRTKFVQRSHHVFTYVRNRVSCWFAPLLRQPVGDNGFVCKLSLVSRIFHKRIVLLDAFFMLVSCIVYSSILKIEAICYPETSVKFYGLNSNPVFKHPVAYHI
jgi:hypothetical protein